MSVAVIIAAGGLSSRMGSWKPAMDYRNEPLIFHSLKAALATPWRVILVGGYNFDKLQRLLSLFLDTYPVGMGRIELVENTDYSLGSAGTFLAGLSASSEEWLALTLGDLPNLTGRLITEIYAERKYPACRPIYQKTPGHPVLLHRDTLPGIRQRWRELAKTPRPGKEISMRNLLTEVHPIQCPDPAVVFDVDRPTPPDHPSLSPR